MVNSLYLMLFPCFDSMTGIGHICKELKPAASVSDPRFYGHSFSLGNMENPAHTEQELQIYTVLRGRTMGGVRFSTCTFHSRESANNLSISYIKKPSNSMDFKGFFVSQANPQVLPLPRSVQSDMVVECILFIL